MYKYTLLVNCAGYLHPQPPPPGNVMSITCVGSYNGRVYFGDYTQGWLHSLDLNFQDEQEVLRGVNPVELKVTPAGFVYVDHLNNYVRSVDVGGPLASPTSTPAAPYATVTATAVSTHNTQHNHIHAVRLNYCFTFADLVGA
jgi:hypothetical protein